VRNGPYLVKPTDLDELRELLSRSALSELDFAAIQK